MNDRRTDARNADATIHYAVTDPEAPIPFLVTDMPVPYRVRVGTMSPDLREFMVPTLRIKGSTVPLEDESETRLRSVA